MDYRLSKLMKIFKGRENEMKAVEAAELIEAIANSINKNPSQFNFQVNVIGTQGSAYGGGTGVSGQAIGGAPGSTAIGYQSSMNGASVEIANRTANARIQQEISELEESLSNIASELRRKEPDRNRINTIMSSIKDWAPDMIKSILIFLITKSLVGLV